MIIGGVDLTSKFDIKEISGLDITAPIEIEEFEPKSGNGSEISIYKFKRREVTVTGDFFASTYTNIRGKVEEIGSLLPFTKIDVPIQFDGDPRTYYGIVRETKTAEEPTKGEIDIVLYCQPFRYGDEVSEEDIAGVEHTNNGSAPSLGIIAFTLASETSMNISLVGTTGLIAIDSAPAGSYEADLKNRTLKKDGVLANTYLDFSTTVWETFAVPVGAYQINCSEAVQINYTYDEAYR